MASRNKMTMIALLVLALITLHPTPSIASDIFREYIGAEFTGVKFSDVPVNPDVEFHFILSFAIDYVADGSSPTNGNFNIFWDTNNLSPSEVAAVKQSKSNVRVAVSLGGDTVGNGYASFNPSSVDSWVDNAVNSLTGIIQQYNLDGIDIDYEHFSTDPDTFAECIGRLITALKNNGVISFASIAPFDNEEVQRHYLALWSKYASVIDYVNFQFYAYESSTTVAQFLSYFETQSSNYYGGRLLASFGNEPNSGGLTPANGFFNACKSLKMQGKLGGIFVWSADNSVNNGFQYERTTQYLLAGSR